LVLLVLFVVDHNVEESTVVEARRWFHTSSTSLCRFTLLRNSVPTMSSCELAIDEKGEEVEVEEEDEEDEEEEG